MEKKEAQVLLAARDALIKVAEERDAVKEELRKERLKLAAIETRLECEKLAAQMHEKGINTDQDFVDLVASLEKEASRGRLPVIQEAVSMSAPNMGVKTASINNDETSGMGASQLEQYLVGSIA